MTCCPKDRGLLLFCSSLESNFEIPRISKQKRTSKKKKKNSNVIPGAAPNTLFFAVCFRQMWNFSYVLPFVIYWIQIHMTAKVLFNITYKTFLDFSSLFLYIGVFLKLQL